MANVYLIFNFLLLPLGILAYMGGLGVGLAAGFICLLFFLFYVFYVNAQFISVVPTFFAFGITPIGLGVLRTVTDKIKSSLSEELKESEKTTEVLRDKDIRLDSELRKLDTEVSEIASLYEITKAMSATLLFNDIFQIFSEFLKRNFRFIACKLILIKQDREGCAIEKVYKIEEGPSNVVAPELVDIEILNEISKAKRIIYWQDFIAIPLIAQNRIIGILNVEGLEEEALEKFLIVSRQFSLEIEKVRLYETVQELAITDGLTGISVRRYFLERLQEEFERSLKHNFKLSFLMIDLDYFKECNDKFGHLVGDVILKEVARVLKQNIREIDLLGRYGGEEFSLFLPETDKDGALLVGERLRGVISNRTFKAYDETLRMTISIGVSTFPYDTQTSTELIEYADQALYEAKAQGRNRVVAFKGN